MTAARGVTTIYACPRSRSQAHRERDERSEDVYSSDAPCGRHGEGAVIMAHGNELSLGSYIHTSPTSEYNPQPSGREGPGLSLTGQRSWHLARNPAASHSGQVPWC